MDKLSQRESDHGERPFPVMGNYPGFPKYVRWSALDDDWAQKIHGQDLKKLASRGGLDPHEIYANLKRIGFKGRNDPNGVEFMPECLLQPLNQDRAKEATPEQIANREKILQAVKAIELKSWAR